MYKLPSCNLQWINTVVDTFATTTTSSLPTVVQESSFNKAAFIQCCDAPGQCRFVPEGQDPLHDCNSYGILGCAVGNYKYLDLTHYPANKTVPTAITGLNPDYREAEHCHQEGTLTKKRSIPCCPAHLSRFLKSKQPCYPRFDEYEQMEKIICQPGDAGQCGTSLEDWNGQSWTYHTRFQGEHTLILPVYALKNQTNTLSELELQCIEEVEFGTRTDGNTTCVPVVEASCNDAGGNRPDSNSNGKGNPNEGVSPMRRRQEAYRGRGGFAKSFVLLVFTPLLLQMLFL